MQMQKINSCPQQLPKGNNMKRKISKFIVILFAVFMVFVGVFVGKFEEYIDWKQIRDDQITEQEQIDFENQLGTKTFYYYHSLNSEQKQVYIMIYSMLNDFSESRRLEIPQDELQDILIAVLYDNSELFWVGTNYQFLDYESSVEFIPAYRFTEEEAKKISNELNKKISEIVAGAEAFSTDYEKELYFHNYICENVVYDEASMVNSGGYGDSAHSALLDGKSICEGYSRAMQVLLDKVGIDNYLVVGDGKTEDGTEPHMWNIVEIDGKNYHLDATWNDTVNETNYGYLYFNVSDEFISSDHLNIEPANNNCSDMNANYFVMNNLYVERFKNYASIVSPVGEALKNSNDNTVEILFANEAELSKAIDELENNNYNFFDFVDEAVKMSGKNLQNDEIEYYTLDGYDYLCLVFKEG